MKRCRACNSGSDRAIPWSLVDEKSTSEGLASHRVARPWEAAVMPASKRRPASTQAVSRKVEGNEPRKHALQEGRRRQIVRKSTLTQPRWRGCGSFLGVGDHGMRDTKTTRQPGRPWRCFRRNNSTE